jgi:hypothetical protein
LIRWLREWSDGGRRYECLMSQAERARNPAWKARFKVRVLAALMSSDRSKSHFRNTVKERLRQRFPTVYAFLKLLKERDRLRRRGKPDKAHCRAGRTLQTFEATLMIDTISRRLIEERPDLPLFTIHDCLVTTVEDLDYVRVVIEDEFARLGIGVGLKVKLWGKE